MLLNILLVGTGGFVGSALRYLVSLIELDEAFLFPLKTFCINIVGTFVFGFVAAWALKNSNMDERLALCLKVGLCGGFTTLSAFANESLELFKTGNGIVAVIYILLTVLGSIFALLAAEFLVEHI